MYSKAVYVSIKRTEYQKIKGIACWQCLYFFIQNFSYVAKSIEKSFYFKDFHSSEPEVNIGIFNYCSIISLM